MCECLYNEPFILKLTCQFSLLAYFHGQYSSKVHVSSHGNEGSFIYLFILYSIHFAQLAISTGWNAT